MINIPVDSIVSIGLLFSSVIAHDKLFFFQFKLALHALWVIVLEHEYSGLDVEAYAVNFHDNLSVSWFEIIYGLNNFYFLFGNESSAYFHQGQ